MSLNFVAVVVLGLMLGTDGIGEEPRHDGEWWLSLSQDEQEMFALGFVDCACFHRLDSLCRRGLSARQLAEYAALYYYRNADARLRLIREVFREQVPRASFECRERGGEVFEGPHGFCLGEFWRQIHVYGHEEARAFVAGYLDCYENVVKGELTFPESAQEYERKIDEWFGLNEDTIREGTEDVPIADVLMKFGVPKAGSKDKAPKR